MVEGDVLLEDLDYVTNRRACATAEGNLRGAARLRLDSRGNQNHR
jgi:hypothetical protein